MGKVGSLDENFGTKHSLRGLHVLRLKKIGDLNR
jgi:hypothetical protein